MIWMKFLHVATIAVWGAGLLCLPALYLQRGGIPAGDRLQVLRRLVRHLYVRVISPAAFVAIASGTALIFQRGTFEAWFSIKLAFVGVLAVIHILTGLVIAKLFEESQYYPLWRFVAANTVTLAVIVAILFMVLGKPDLRLTLPEAMAEPGALGRIGRDLLGLPQ